MFFLFLLQRHPAVTPPSYPQVQAPIVNNPAFWERLGLDTFGTDTLFFAFYYQQVLLAFCNNPSYSVYHYVVILSIFSSALLSVEYLSAIFGCKRTKEAIVEIPQEI